MNAIRKDEELDNIHSMYVDQWDWEVVISKEDRTMDYFKAIVSKIYNALLDVEFLMIRHYPQLGHSILPDEIFFITSQELEYLYPSLTPKEREKEIVKLKKAVCILQIGDILKSGNKHDGRAPDYDDWKLNGDILFWYPLLDRSIELSSMGIRVDEEALELSSMGIRVDDQALLEQLEKADAKDRLSLPYHQNIINNVLPLSIGGGIGQSRLCLFFLRKAHIGEVQASLWDEYTMKVCEEKHVELL